MSSIYDYAERPVVLREPARRNGAVICPECGNIVEDSKGSGHPVRVPVDDVVDDVPVPADRRTLPTHGWVCQRHDYDVVLPAHTTADASNITRGWTGVRIRFADGTTRFAPVPQREVVV